ncbi:ABC transporter ATP-binding protein [Hathewaya histolytica]|uniref:Iron chelate uptake ABC transporter FeCT family, ATP-binding protein n=1 Tax=Hathewaya histolytica TaxID=1498 RepID=A0A4U9QWZ5_HATHI|nr:ABC transporter ATP-binding protein [Hathewaya histolytica]VTQ83286.1 iron chelate uptake ABC transporter FeCT family, ATP-binding protein [Hathewaya histolytica]
MYNIKTENITYKINNIDILKNINISINYGEFVGLVGPNGCGKSTLLKNIYRIYTPTGGCIYLNEKNIFKLTNKEIAKQMAVVAQENSTEFDFSVLEIVLMGRFAHKELFQSDNKRDMNIAEEALHTVGMEEFKERSFLSLSGGEKQRVLIARALVQEAKVLILDEPTNHLDIGYQLQIMDIIKSQRLTTFSAIHDLNIAAFYCDKIFLMSQGEVVKFGTPEEVLTKDMIKKLFRVEAYISKNPCTNKLNISYIPGSYKV